MQTAVKKTSEVGDFTNEIRVLNYLLCSLYRLFWSGYTIPNQIVRAKGF